MRDDEFLPRATYNLQLLKCWQNWPEASRQHIEKRESILGTHNNKHTFTKESSVDLQHSLLFVSISDVEVCSLRGSKHNAIICIRIISSESPDKNISMLYICMIYVYRHDAMKNEANWQQPTSLCSLCCGAMKLWFWYITTAPITEAWRCMRAWTVQD